jgi:hypothetical protein
MIAEQEAMPLFEEKREKTDRRQRDDGPPLGCRERRIKKDRRQTAISEISFQEWTRYLLRFKKHAEEKAARRRTMLENAESEEVSSSRVASRDLPGRNPRGVPR